MRFAEVLAMERGRKWGRWVMAGIVAAGFCFPLYAQQDGYARLLAQAQHASGKKQATLFAELANLDLEQLQNNFQGAHYRQASHDLWQLSQHASDAMQVLQSDAEHGKKSGLKKVELQFRKLDAGLRALAREAERQDRPPLQAADHYVNALRDRMLRLMFSSKRELRRNALQEATFSPNPQGGR